MRRLQITACFGFVLRSKCFKTILFRYFCIICRMHKSRVVPAKPKISPVTIALQQLSGETLIAEFRPEGNRSVLFNLLFGLIDTFYS